ncbi:MAG: amino acid transporter [Actinobacteria bacterium HGW-Actinobacteria-6]|nr:MAG: amino acid transporter [Actinobacteria bacterium HGW-Actinobacteria-6]
MSTLAVAASGFGLGASLIMAIGAQNAFVLRQGLQKQHVFAVALVCALVDAILISLGAGGFGAIVSSHPTITAVAAWGGVAFLAVYGGRSFLAALHPGALDSRSASAEKTISLGATITATLAVSLLNPHVYLDTVVLLGSVAAQHPADERLVFALGAMAASFVWFFSIAYGARLLAPLFARPVAWRVLDVFVGCVMWWIAISLALGQIVV